MLRRLKRGMSHGMGGVNCFTGKGSNSEDHTLSRSFGYYPPTFENVAMVDFYILVNEICEDESEGIAIEFLIESVEYHLRRRGQQMNKYVTDNFKCVLVRGIESGKITASLEEDVLRYRAANSELIITELDQSVSETNDVSVERVDSIHSAEDGESCGSQSSTTPPKNNELVIRYTDDDNGSVVPLWDQDYVPYLSNRRRRFSDSDEHLPTVQESLSGESLNSSPAEEQPVHASAVNDFAEEGCIVLTEISLLPSADGKENVVVVHDTSPTNNCLDFIIVPSNGPDHILSPINNVEPNGICSTANYPNSSEQEDEYSMVSFQLGNQTVDSETGSEYSTDRLTTSTKDRDEYFSLENTFATSPALEGCSAVSPPGMSQQNLSTVEPRLLQQSTSEQAIVVSAEPNGIPSPIIVEPVVTVSLVKPISAVNEIADVNEDDQQTSGLPVIGSNTVQHIRRKKSIESAELSRTPFSTAIVPAVGVNSLQQIRHEKSISGANEIAYVDGVLVKGSNAVQHIERKQPLAKSTELTKPCSSTTVAPDVKTSCKQSNSRVEPFFISNGLAKVNESSSSTKSVSVTERNNLQRQQNGHAFPVSEKKRFPGMNNSSSDLSTRLPSNEINVSNRSQQDDSVQESDLSGSADVSRDSSSTIKTQISPNSSVANVNVSKKSVASRFGFLRTKDRLDTNTNLVVLPEERPTQGPAEQFPVAHSTPTSNDETKRCVTTNILELKEYEASRKPKLVIQEPEIVRRRHLQLFTSPKDTQERKEILAAKQRCASEFSDLKQLPKILFLLRSFETRRSRTATWDELHSRLEAHKNTLRSLVELFTDENNLRMELPRFYEIINCRGEEYVVLKNHVAKLNIVKIETDTVEDIIFQALTLGGGKMSIFDLCDDLIFLLTSFMIKNSNHGSKLDHLAQFVEQPIEEQTKIIFKMLQGTPQLYDFNPNTSEASIYEEVVVVGSSRRHLPSVIL